MAKKTKQIPLSEGDAQLLAEKIATDVMTSGVSNDEMADRMVLMKDGRELGGWSFPALTRRIEKHLRGEL